MQYVTTHFCVCLVRYVGYAYDQNSSYNKFHVMREYDIVNMTIFAGKFMFLFFQLDHLDFIFILFPYWIGSYP